ncbi:glycosyltransferase family 4 protein [Candidatus Woesearchaeota archaeon]|nr:glycosyltransferase family 4 protein [Candidatus Woesearchaeota archaeon]
MRVCVYDWALHSFGGGQKFDCKIAEHLSKKHDVDLLTLFPVEKKVLEKAYNINLSKVNIKWVYKKKCCPAYLKMLSVCQVSKLSANYDVFINADAQELVKPRAKHNIMYCHFFEPKWYRQQKGFFDFVQLVGVYLIKTVFKNYANEYDVYCNSNYTKHWLKTLWGVEAKKVIYPPIDIPTKVNYENKKNIILSVGRLTRDKNYEFNIECFKKIYDSGIKDYQLIICGLKDDESYYNELKKQISGYPIKLMTNLTNKELNKVYAESKLFLHSKGLEINEEKYPGLLEHFGMSTAEAMSYGCIPIVVNKGGQKEIVEEGKNGFLFNNEEEAVKKLAQIITNKKIQKKLALNAREKAKNFSLQNMQKEFDNIIKNLK